MKLFAVIRAQRALKKHGLFIKTSLNKSFRPHVAYANIDILPKFKHNKMKSLDYAPSFKYDLPIPVSMGQTKRAAALHLLSEIKNSAVKIKGFISKKGKSKTQAFKMPDFFSPKAYKVERISHKKPHAHPVFLDKTFVA